jgi:hypothetical protein
MFLASTFRLEPRRQLAVKDELAKFLPSLGVLSNVCSPLPTQSEFARHLSDGQASSRSALKHLRSRIPPLLLLCGNPGSLLAQFGERFPDMRLLVLEQFTSGANLVCSLRQSVKYVGTYVGALSTH